MRKSSEVMDSVAALGGGRLFAPYIDYRPAGEFGGTFLAALRERRRAGVWLAEVLGGRPRRGLPRATASSAQSA